MMLRFSGTKEERYPASHLPFEKIQSGIFTDMLLFVTVVV